MELEFGPSSAFRLDDRVEGPFGAAGFDHRSSRRLVRGRGTLAAVGIAAERCPARRPADLEREQ